MTVALAGRISLQIDDERLAEHLAGRAAGQLVGGIIEIALGFWAAGYYGRSAVLLVAWVAAFATIRGVRDIVFAFRVRELQHPAHG